MASASAHAQPADPPAEPAEAPTAEPAQPTSEPAPEAPAASPAPDAGPVLTDDDLARMSGSETIEIRGRSVADEKRQSAEAVTVVDTEQARRQTADLGEVLARTRGVAVRRYGGLGSSATLSLGGLTDDQVRFFLDGIPLQLAGFPFGIANLPVNLVDRIEVYNGVVPVRFGADALGGGINLVTNDTAPGTHGAASYEVGSFGTHRLTLAARHRTASDLYARVDGFFDRAANDYGVDAIEANPMTGAPVDVHVPRFHDGYTAGGGTLELGVLHRPWADRLTVRAFASGLAKDNQTDPTVSRVYGDVTNARATVGGSLRYGQQVGPVALDAIAGYVFSHARFLDDSTCVFNWYGDCFVMNPAGEIDDMPHDQRTWSHAAFGRVAASWKLAPHHELHASIAPTYTTRSGDDRYLTGGRDPLSAERTLTTVVSGLEYQVDVLGDRLQNLLFVKHYYQKLASEDPLPGGEFLRRDRDTQRAGFGDGIRYRFTDELYAKLSYEWATRLPTAGEVFGDDVFTAANLQLAPESSHNLNAGVALDNLVTRGGAVSAAATGFLRLADDLIQPFLLNADIAYQNIAGARSLGVETSAAWTSPGDYVQLDGALTYQEFRNNDPGGPYGAYDGERIPNQPYLFGNANARFALHDRFMARDEIALLYGVRYVHAFLRDWATLGANPVAIPSQWLHSAGVSYRVRTDRVDWSTTFEVSNLTDDQAFDYYRVQRPGRAFYVKTAVSF